MTMTVMLAVVMVTLIDKDTVVEIGEVLQKAMKVGKRMLKNWENMASHVRTDRNRWDQVSTCLKEVDSVISEYPYPQLNK